MKREEEGEEGRKEECGKGNESGEEGREGEDKKFPIQILSPGKHALPGEENHMQPSMPVRVI